jgi:hypothetical protein
VKKISKMGIGVWQASEEWHGDDEMRQDGNIDVTTEMGLGQIASSICSRVVDGN